MSVGLPDWHHVERAIAAGDRARLEEIAVMLDGFPAGSDPVEGSRCSPQARPTSSAGRSTAAADVIRHHVRSSSRRR